MWAQYRQRDRFRRITELLRDRRKRRRICHFLPLPRLDNVAGRAVLLSQTLAVFRIYRESALCSKDCGKQNEAGSKFHEQHVGDPWTDYPCEVPESSSFFVRGEEAVSVMTALQRRQVNVSHSGLLSFDLLPTMATAHTGQFWINGRDWRMSNRLDG
jgi:hypothetical protein